MKSKASRGDYTNISPKHIWILKIAVRQRKILHINKSFNPARSYHSYKDACISTNHPDIWSTCWQICRVKHWPERAAKRWQRPAPGNGWDHRRGISKERGDEDSTTGQCSKQDRALHQSSSMLFLSTGGALSTTDHTVSHKSSVNRGLSHKVSSLNTWRWNKN